MKYSVIFLTDGVLNNIIEIELTNLLFIAKCLECKQESKVECQFGD